MEGSKSEVYEDYIQDNERRIEIARGEDRWRWATQRLDEDEEGDDLDDYDLGYCLGCFSRS